MSDNIKLTNDEREALRHADAEWDSNRLPETLAAVESIVAARVRDLTDSHELMATQFRTMQREKEHGWREAEKWEVKADALATELAAANTRIAELEGERHDWERLARDIALRLSDYHQRDIRESVARIRAALGEDGSRRSDTEQQQQQINTGKGEEH